jgi:5-methylcytosine-specific restriction endonuclease McrA
MSKLQDRVLVLNQSYEPIDTMSVRHAMCKISKTDSTLEVLEWSTREFNSANDTYPAPSVLRLRYYVDMKKRRNKSNSKRDRIYTRDKFRCQYCGIKVKSFHKALGRNLLREDLTLDHIHPQSRGGETKPSNLVTCCKPCNQIKGALTPEEARMPLLASKTLLRVHLEHFAIRAYADAFPEWKKYLYMDNGGDSGLSHKGDHSYG